MLEEKIKITENLRQVLFRCKGEGGNHKQRNILQQAELWGRGQRQEGEGTKTLKGFVGHFPRQGGLEALPVPAPLPIPG